jgi:allantoate deiminase
VTDTPTSDDRFFVPIDAGALQEHVDALGAIGRHPAGGLYRTLYTPAWQEAMDLVRRWLEEIGLETRTDAVGNLFGRLAGREPARAVLSGSHVDTVKQGGRYDGALGIHAAIAAIGALRAAYGQPRKSLEVYVICEEEGSRFHCNFWGSRALTGTIERDEVDRLRDADGISIGEAMRASGLDPSAIDQARRADVDAFVELHIEQGRVLQDAGDAVGIVQTITGIHQMQVTVTGRQDHAGTTSMEHRRDALAGAAEMITRIADAAAALGPPAVATVGITDTRPGAVNIVPGVCTFTVDVRHADPVKWRALIADVNSLVRAVAAQRQLTVAVEPLIEVEPTPLDADLRAILEAAARAEGLPFRTMPSGAGHDSQVMARRFPTGMIFVPSRDGRSHCPEEYTPIEQIVGGVRVLARALHALAY